MRTADSGIHSSIFRNPSKRSGINVRLFLGFLFLLQQSLTPAQPLLPLEEEAPESILELDVADREVELFMKGSWNALASEVAGTVIKPGIGLAPLDLFPGLIPGFLFEQTPDLTFSLWLMKRYFFEFSISGSFEDNSFLAGYQGDPESTLRHVYVGNRDIRIDPYPFLMIPDSGGSSLGAELELGSLRSTHQVMLRFDNDQAAKKVFLGSFEVAEATISEAGYLQGRFFLLPDDEVQDLTVLIEDNGGGISGNDGRRYRTASLSDAVIDSADGTIVLNNKHNGRILVYYTKSGKAVGSDELGKEALARIGSDGRIDLEEDPVDFTWDTSVEYLPEPNTMSDLRRVSIGGDDYLLLWEPGLFSPFEVLAAYPLPAEAPAETWRIRITRVRKGGTDPLSPSEVSFRAFPGDGYFEVYRNPDLRGDLHNRYPLLADSSSEPEAFLYGPAAKHDSGSFEKELLIRILHPVSGYFLEPDIIPGSISVSRNGRGESRFTADYDIGIVEFDIPISPTDRLEINYRRRISLPGAGDVLLAWGNRFTVDPRMELELALGARWNALPEAYSTEPLSRTGAVVTSAGIRGEIDDFSYEASAGISYAYPDTTGLLRLQGMEEPGFSVSLSEGIVYPSAYPSAAPEVGLGPEAEKRGRLFYKDYRSYGLLGATVLQSPEWPCPDDQIFPYETGSKPGPYAVSADAAGIPGESLVVDFECEEDEWVGVQVPVFSGPGLTDLSHIHALTLSYKSIDVSGSYDIFLQIGELGEDLDGDGLLDYEVSPSSRGFTFDDTGNDVSLLVGGGPRMEGNGRTDTEDIDGNGRLDEEIAGRVLSLKITGEPITENTGWRTYIHYLTDDELTKLKRTRGVRLIVSGSGCAGRLMVDSISFTGTRFGIVAYDSEGIVKLREIEERTSRFPAVRTLEEEYPEISESFHSKGEPQKILELDWSGFSPDENWTIRGFSDTGTAGVRYREIVHYIRIPSLQPTGVPRLTFSLLDSDGHGIRWFFEPTIEDRWKEVVVVPETGDIYLGGITPPGADVLVDPGFGSLNQFLVTMEDASEGVIYLDELHLSDPLGSLGIGAALKARFSKTGAVLSVRNIPVIRDLSVEQEIQIQSPGFSSLYGNPAGIWSSLLRTDIGLGLFFTDLLLEAEVQGVDRDFSLSGGHTLIFPRFQFPISYTDFFHLQGGGPELEFHRSSTLAWNIGEVLSGNADVSAYSLESLLTQKWLGSLSLFHSLDFGLTLAKITLDYVHMEDDYVSSWILGHRFLAPRQNAADYERSGDFGLSLVLPASPIGFDGEFSPAYRCTGITEAERNQTDRLYYGFSIPIQLQTKNELTLAPGYHRSWEGEFEEKEKESYFQDFEAMVYHLGQQQYLFTQIPVWEFFYEPAESLFSERTSGFPKSSYRPELNMTVDRRLSSHWSGLILPTHIDIKTGKLLEREGDLTRFSNSFDLLYRTNAINLFGSYGSYPTFPFYGIDEFSTAFTVNVLLNPERTDRTFRWENFLSFEGTNGNILTLTGQISFLREQEKTTSGTGSASYNWFVRPEGGIPLPLFREEIMQKAFLSHTEILSFSAESGKNTGTGHPISLLLRHDTKLVLPERGFIRGELGLGMDTETYPSIEGREILVRLAVLFLLEGRISY